ncbi:RHS repeat protein [Psychromonas sp. Urea-02u-13]|uniref:RHS repeat protein n=1 Tax=Psychromonas sp. Urea-02u-13 TaxID=2058326 RepID=UPI000C3495A5|nr:RHS repeat protein [Psychromonas sp. Urea-02u-13]PKG37224.1 hypothetical protein CXF74_20000 [Psychromonas sp. Urea-02u-13]
MSSIASNAYNFSEYINSGVDTRTGMFSISLSLGSFISHQGSGLIIPLSLGYAVSSNFDSGFGCGWSIPISSFNNTSRILSLSSGQSFVIEKSTTSSEFDIPYRRLKDISVSEVSTTGELKIAYKDGKHEFVNIEKGTLNKVVSPNGLEIYYDHSRVNGNEILWRIADTPIEGTGHEVIIDWWTEKWLTRIYFYNNGTLYKSLVCYKSSGSSGKKLKKIDFSEGLSMSLEYLYSSISGYELITEVAHPTGLIEHITYFEPGHATASGSPLSNIPYVTNHSVIYGTNQPNRSISYSYSDKNYLGAYSSESWLPYQDTLFRVRSDYKYTSTEVINNEIMIIRTFNKYHSQDSEFIYHMNEQQQYILFQEDKFEYFSDLSKRIDYQPPKYTLLKKKEMIMYQENKTRSFVSIFDYDDYANEIYRKTPDGTEYITIYYPLEGSSECPPAPDNIVAFISFQKVIPRINIDGSRDKPQVNQFTYTSLPKLHDDNEYFVLLKEKNMGTDNALWMKGVLEYFNDSENFLTYGRSSRSSLTHNTHTRTQGFVYSYINGECSITINLLTHDGLEISTESVVECLTGNLTKVVDESGIVQLSNFDSLGRTIKTTTSPNTPEESITLYSYNFGSGNLSITTTELNGVAEKKTFNNAGKIIMEEVVDSNGIFLPITEYYYDSYGRCLEEVDIDWFSDIENRIATNSEYSLSGEIKRVLHSDGREELYDSNFADLSHTYELKGLFRVYTEVDLFGNEIFKETYDSNNNLILKTINEYDGYSNLISQTDIKGRTTRYEYDQWQRVISITKNVDGEAVIQNYEYCRFAQENLATNISVNQVSLGTQEYDGLFRMSSRTYAGGKSELYSYNNSKFMPSHVISANNNRLEFGYNSQSQETTSINVVGQNELSINYQYDVSGNIKSSISLNESSSYTYNALGQLESETIVIDGVSRTSTYNYSLLGKLISSVDYFGNREEYSYDQYGRTSSIIAYSNSGAVLTNYEYDSFSRVIKEREVYRTEEMITNLTLDSLGLELVREVLINGQTLCRFEQDYTESIQISNRRFYKDSQLTTEEFIYDSFDRLVTYQVAGPNAPKDEFLNILASQSFTHDVLNNITGVTTNFIDESVNYTSFTYMEHNPVQLKSVTNTHADYPAYVEFQYDAEGNLLNDEKLRSYSYNAYGQVESVSDNGQLLSNCHYDSSGQIISKVVEGTKTDFYYQEGELKNESLGEAHSSYTASGQSRLYNGITLNTLQFMVSNAQDSIVNTLALTEDETGEIVMAKTERSYTPYGEG